MNEEWRNELVTKGAAYDALNEVMIAYIPRLFGGLEEIPLECTMAIVKMPSAQPQRIKGRWMLKGHLWECDRCGCRINRANPLKGNIWNYNFCPNCGAWMEEEDEAD